MTDTTAIGCVELLRCPWCRSMHRFEWDGGAWRGTCGHSTRAALPAAEAQMQRIYDHRNIAGGSFDGVLTRMNGGR